MKTYDEKTVWDYIQVIMKVVALYTEIELERRCLVIPDDLGRIKETIIQAKTVPAKLTEDLDLFHKCLDRLKNICQEHLDSGKERVADNVELLKISKCQICRGCEK